MLRALRRGRTALISLAVLLMLLAAAAFPSLFAPHRVFDLRQISLMDAFTPPVWLEGGTWRYPLGTDDQGRDVLSAMIYGLRVSVTVGIGGVALAVAIGVTVGLVAGFAGGCWMPS